MSRRGSERWRSVNVRGQVGRAVAAWSVGLGVISAFESFVDGDRRGWLSLGLGIAAGALLGLVKGTIYAPLTFLSSRGLGICSTLLGAVAGLLVAVDVGALDHLSGRYTRLATAALGVGLGGGAAVGALVAWLHPSAMPGAPKRPHRLASYLAVIAGVAVLTWHRHAWWLVSYPIARVAVAATGWVLICVPSELFVTHLRREVSGRLAVAAFGGVGLVLAFITARADPDAVSPLADGASRRLFLMLARSLTDVDRDQESSLFGGADCAPFDKGVNSRATEIPGNGVDDNCRFGDPPDRSPGSARLPAPPDSETPVNVMLVTIDTLRPDHVGAYGYRRETTPELTKLARRGRLFTRAYTTGGWTCLAMPSLAAGVRVREMTWHVVSAAELGIRRRPGEPELQPYTLPRELPHPPLPFWLLRRKLQTLSSFSSEVPFMHRGWWRKHFTRTSGPELTTDEELTDAALDMLRSVGDKPFFLWVHYFGPHDLYGGSAETLRNESVDHYDEQILKTDQQLGRLIRAVEKKSRPTATIVTSDHGEVLGHGPRYHGIDLTEASIRVPLVIAGPRVKRGREDAPVSLVDIFPTVLAWTETPGPEGLPGADLRSPLPKDRVVIADVIRVSKRNDVFVDRLAVISSTHKLTYDFLGNSRTLVAADDWRPDPSRLPVEEIPSQLIEAAGFYLEHREGRLVVP